MAGKFTKWVLGSLFVGAVGVLLDALVLEKYFFAVKTFKIGNKGGCKSLKLIHLTDLHLKTFLLPQYHRLASKINKIQPDLIFITGDVLDSSGNIKLVERFLSLLDRQVKKAAIPGNHDHLNRASLEALREVYAKYNCDLLINESKAYTISGRRIMVTGLDDFIQGKGDLEAAVKEVGYEKDHILLIHSPLQQEEAKHELEKINSKRDAANKLNIRHIFAGHNHGGQVRLPAFVPVLPKMSGNYVNGWYNHSKPFLYVSKGFGTSRLPFRFWARSEVTVFNYHV